MTRPYLGTLVLATAALLIALMIHVAFGSGSLTRVFLVAVLLSAISYGIWPGMFAALISVLFYDFFFLPPIYSLEISSTADFLNLGFFLLTAVTVGLLAARVRRYAIRADNRALTAEQLVAFSRHVAEAITVQDVLDRASARITAGLGTPAVVLLAQDDDILVNSLQTGPSGLAPGTLCALADRWSRHDRGAGEIEPIVVDDWSFHGLRCHGETFCLVGIGLGHPIGHPTLLAAFTQQTALALGHIMLRQELHDARVQAESEAFGATLLNSVSHDLRGPLTAILAATGTLEDQWRHLRDDAREELIVTAREQTEHLAAYVTNLLDISQIDAGAIGPRLEPVMLSDLLGAVLHTMLGRLNDHCLVLDVPDDLPPLSADIALLRQTLVNILDNAVKYAPRGSRIRIVADAVPETVELRIMDEGPGVPQIDLERLFQKFFRCANTSEPGTGLGLTICRGIMTAMGGTIDATNRFGGGLCICLRLPLFPLPASPSGVAPDLAQAET